MKRRLISFALLNVGSCLFRVIYYGFKEGLQSEEIAAVVLGDAE